MLSDFGVDFKGIDDCGNQLLSVNVHLLLGIDWEDSTFVVCSWIEK